MILKTSTLFILTSTFCAFSFADTIRLEPGQEIRRIRRAHLGHSIVCELPQWNQPPESRYRDSEVNDRGIQVIELSVTYRPGIHPNLTGEVEKRFNEYSVTGQVFAYDLESIVVIGNRTPRLEESDRDTEQPLAVFPQPENERDRYGRTLYSFDGRIELIESDRILFHFYDSSNKYLGERSQRAKAPPKYDDPAWNAVESGLEETRNRIERLRRELNRAKQTPRKQW